MSRQKAKETIAMLAARYAEHEAEYHHADYNEQKTRQDFINPLFKALGWDIDNEKGYAEAYREVIYEDKVKVKGKAKAPDYGFRMPGQGSKRLFYVEAKKPAVKIKVQKEPAYQLRRYGSSAQVPVSVLSNFEDLLIYDCRRVPREDDSATVACLRKLHYTDYGAEFDYLYDTFSYEAVMSGRFDKYVQGAALKRGTDTLDRRFVQSLDEWRGYLAVSIAKHNRSLNEEELNYAVQQTLDRIIFLRFCEDRAVEPYENMRHSMKLKGDAYGHLLDLFREADAKYNSGLFDFKKDTITPQLRIDPKVIKNVVEEMYYPRCNYEFSVMPVEILGNAYEQFLGRVIKISRAGSVAIEEKPEVRKAGGVYYTPQYIVDYIVQNTVGKLVAGKAPKDIEKIKIADPACGSGSFLLGAYRYLLRYHQDWYHANGYAARKMKDHPLTPAGTLATREKKRILRNNIYGVDLDANAVEVSKLSLLLCCMEGETAASVSQQMGLYHERVLPNLDDHIKDGNSLIDTDIYDSEIDLGYEKKIKPFSWQKAFPEVFKYRKQGAKSDFRKQFDRVKGQEDMTQELIEKYNTLDEPKVDYGMYEGFDIVIGNPPYGADLSDEQIKYLKAKYSTSVWRGESYVLFIERALNLLRQDGNLGFIIPDTILNLGFTQSVREYLLRNSFLREIVSLPSNIFAGATVDTVLLFADRTTYSYTFHPGNVEVKAFQKKAAITSLQNPDRTFIINTNEWYKQGAFNVNSDDHDQKLIVKLEKGKVLVSDIGAMFSGIKAYEVGKGTPVQTELIRDTKPYTSDKRESSKWSVHYDGKDIGRYQIFWENNNWINYGEWLAAPRDPDVFKGEKILVRKIIAKTLIATYVPETSYCNTLLFVLKLKSKAFSYKSVLSILNSNLIGWYFRKKFQITDEDTFPQIMIRDILQFPIPDVSNKNDKELNKHVDLLLNLNEELKDAKLPSKQEQIKQRIAHSEDRINALVYELYELTADEIKIIEESINS